MHQANNSMRKKNVNAMWYFCHDPWGYCQAYDFNAGDVPKMNGWFRPPGLRHAAIGRGVGFIIALLSLVLVAAPRSTAQTVTPANDVPIPDSPICLMIESTARANGLPIDFFARLIWQESRFQPDVIGPMTRTGQRAQGIAQFMPSTAAERSLFEPMNPVAALPKSGEFLAELRHQFGNLGLAAAAYNAGPERVREFLAGSRDLPVETRNYVLAITSRPVEYWVTLVREESEGAFKAEPQSNGESCHDIVEFLKLVPDLFVVKAPQFRGPAWCRYLHHPNLNVCGSVHEEELAINFPNLSKPRSHQSVLKHHRAGTVQSVF
jgi:Transglycosylase SLT domain